MRLQKLKRLIIVGVFLTILPIVSSFGQVEFKVELIGNTYVVSAVPSTTWTGTNGLTASAQVTLTVPTGGFQVSNFQSVNGSWSPSTLITAPTDNPAADYLMVGLSSLGTPDIDYVTGVEEVLFTFENGGACTGPVEIMTDTDPFNPPNSVNANSGNQITTFGSGNQNAFTGPVDVGSANCFGDLPGSSDLSLTKVSNVDSVQVGDLVTFSIVVKNDGPDDANTIEVTDNLPAGLSYSSFTATQGSFLNSVWSVGQLAVGDSATLELTTVVTAEGLSFNTAEISAVNGADPDSTPGNADTTEDDIATDCVSAPYLLCEGENQSLELEAPAGYTDYQWFKDGVAIDAASGGTAQILTVSDAGTYQLTLEEFADIGACGAQLCCPIYVEVGECCPEIQCIPVQLTIIK